MARSARSVADAEHIFETSGRLPSDSAKALGESAQRAGGPGWIQSCMLLGSAHAHAPIHESLGHLGRIWTVSTLTTAQQVQLRREAARHLLAAGFANDALLLLADARQRASGLPELDLTCRVLALLIQIDLGQTGLAPVMVDDLLERISCLEGRITRRDRLWLTTDLLQLVLALCWRAGNKGLALGFRLPQANAGALGPWLDLLDRLQHLPDALGSSATPRLQVLHLLSLQTLNRTQEATWSEQLTELASGLDRDELVAEVWCLLGFSCQLAGHADRAIACHQRTIALANENGARRAAAMSNAELAALFASRGEHEGACLALHALRVDELLLWTESGLPLGRQWLRSTRNEDSIDMHGGSGVMASLHARRACTYIEQNLHGALGTVEVANACGVSRRTIEHAFREAMGCSVKDYVRRCRVAQVRNRLETTTDAVKKIALDLGYPSGTALGREFKLLTGQTITAFRKSQAR